MIKFNQPDMVLEVSLKLLTGDGQRGFCWLIDLNAGYLQLDSEWLQEHGFDSNPKPELGFLNCLVHGDDLPALIQNVENQRHGSLKAFVHVVRFVFPDQTVQKYRIIGAKFGDDDSDCIVGGVAIDQSLTLTPADNGLLSNMLDAAPFAVVGFTDPNVISHANRMACEWLCGGASLSGKSLNSVLNFEGATPGLDVIEFIEEQISSKKDGPRMSLRLFSGLRIVVECELIAQRSVQGNIHAKIVCLRDVTLEVEAVEQIQHAARLSAIGHLAGGVAHDFNNILAGVQGAAELIKIKSGSSLAERERGLVQLIIDSCLEAKDLSLKLSALGRRKFESRDALNIHRLINDAVQSFSLTLSSGIEINVDLKGQSNHGGRPPSGIAFSDS